MSDNELRICDLPHGFVVAGEKLDNLNKRVVTDASHFVISHAAGEWGMGTYTGGRRAPTDDEIAQLATVCTHYVAGRMATTWKIACVPSRNSSTTTRSRKCQRIRPTKSW